MAEFTFLGTRGWDRKAWQYRIADLLNRLPGTCWANLVCWIEFGSPLSQAWDLTACKIDCANNGSCYCGKRRAPAQEKSDA